MPQPPQLKASLHRSTHPVPQSVRPAASQACRAGAAPARPGSQAVTAPMARRRSTWRREAPAATARATASKVELSTESSPCAKPGRCSVLRSRLRELRAQRIPVHIAWRLVLAHATAVVGGCQEMPLLLRLTGRGFTPYPAHAENCPDRLMTDARLVLGARVRYRWGGDASCRDDHRGLSEGFGRKSRTGLTVITRQRASLH